MTTRESLFAAAREVAGQNQKAQYLIELAVMHMCETAWPSKGSRKRLIPEALAAQCGNPCSFVLHLEGNEAAKVVPDEYLGIYGELVVQTEPQTKLVPIIALSEAESTPTILGTTFLMELMTHSLYATAKQRLPSSEHLCTRCSPDKGVWEVEAHELAWNLLGEKLPGRDEITKRYKEAATLDDRRFNQAFYQLYDLLEKHAGPARSEREDNQREVLLKNGLTFSALPRHEVIERARQSTLEAMVNELLSSVEIIDVIHIHRPPQPAAGPGQ